MAENPDTVTKVGITLVPLLIETDGLLWENREVSGLETKSEMTELRRRERRDSNAFIDLLF